MLQHHTGYIPFFFLNISATFLIKNNASVQLEKISIKYKYFFFSTNGPKT